MFFGNIKKFVSRIKLALVPVVTFVFMLMCSAVAAAIQFPTAPNSSNGKDIPGGPQVIKLLSTAQFWGVFMAGVATIYGAVWFIICLAKDKPKLWRPAAMAIGGIVVIMLIETHFALISDAINIFKNA